MFSILLSVIASAKLFSLSILIAEVLSDKNSMLEIFDSNFQPSSVNLSLELVLVGSQIVELSVSF